jgi:hypothetical protein
VNEQKLGSAMSTKTDLFDRAAECERLMNLATEADKKTRFRLLRDMWIALANESGSMSAEELAQRIADIDKIQNGMNSGKAWMQ